jgi:hypothetical protein
MIKDIYLDDNQYIFFGREYIGCDLYGISLNDIERNNPNIYMKTWVWEKASRKSFSKWCDLYMYEEWVCKLFANSVTRKVRIETLSHIYEDALNVLTDDRTALQLASVILSENGRRE